jgi:hypothetical protein
LTDKRRLAVAVLAALVTYVALLAVAAHLSWDVLRRCDPELFYRVNALHLESEIEGAMSDPAAVLSILVFNALTFGVASAVGALVYPARRWIAPAILVGVGFTFWLLRYALMFIGPGVLGAKGAASFELLAMVAWAFGGAWLATKRPRPNHDAG